jgi:hypothetical protein
MDAAAVAGNLRGCPNSSSAKRNDKYSSNLVKRRSRHIKLGK